MKLHFLRQEISYPFGSSLTKFPIAELGSFNTSNAEARHQTQS